MLTFLGGRPWNPIQTGYGWPASGDTGLSFQLEEDFQPPKWPDPEGGQHMLMHLDIAVDDLDAGVARAIEAGATLADFQPQEHVRVMLDPAGHIFDLFISGT
jgi:hypothetical protein